MRATLPALFLGLCLGPLSASNVSIQHDSSAGKVSIQLDGALFTEFLYKDQPRPVLFPVIGPGQVPMTRQFPLRDAAPHEEKDHIHHRSLWYAHGDVNGIDFWAEGPAKGRIQTTAITSTGTRDGEAFFTAENQWLHPEGRPLLSDTTQVRAGSLPDGSRYIDFSITLRATHGQVTFGDTKEGTMAIRTRPEFQLNPDKNPAAAGHALNSQGTSGKAIWGQPARWVAYWAPVAGHTLAVAILDHPQNPRHPTTWHARDYGLIAANPFGLHDFSGGKEPAGAGAITLQPDQHLSFRYRFLFLPAQPTAESLDSLWNAFAKP